MRGARYLVLGGLLLAACEPDAVSQPAAPPSGAAEAAASASLVRGLKLTANGKAIGLKTVMAAKRGGSAIELMLSTRALTCGMISTPFAAIGLEEERWWLSAAEQLQPDGSRSWAVSRVRRWSGGSAQDVPGALIMRSTDTTEGKTVSGHIDVSFKFAKIDGVTAIVGELDATGCGTFSDAPPAARPQVVEVTVAKERFAIQGATFHPGDGSSELRLSTLPTSCSDPSPDDRDFGVRIVYEGEHAEPRRVIAVFLEGTEVLQSHSGFAATKAPFVVTPASSKRAKEDVVRMSLSGLGKVGAYEVKLDGEVVALSCPRRK